MAHSYSNFADAFADLCSQNSVYRTYVEDCYDQCDTADEKANAGDFKWGIRYSVYAIKALATALDQIIHGQYFDPDDSWFYESIYWASQEGGNGAIDMSAILDALWGANPLETFFFVNDIDAMRAAIWNKEISEEKLNELYRHFSI